MVDKKIRKEISVQGAPEALIPKYSTRALFSVNKNKMIISFIFSDGDESQGVVLQRILIDLDHAKHIADTIMKIIEKEKKNE